MTCHCMVLRPGRAEEHCTAALPEVRRNRLHLHPLAAASAPWSALLCLALFPYLWPKPQTEWCALCLLTANTSCQVPVCFSDGLAPPGCGALIWRALLTSLTNLLLNVNQKLIVGECGFGAVFHQMLEKVCSGRTLISERQKTAFSTVDIDYRKTTLQTSLHGLQQNPEMCFEEKHRKDDVIKKLWKTYFTTWRTGLNGRLSLSQVTKDLVLSDGSVSSSGRCVW